MIDPYRTYQPTPKEEQIQKHTYRYVLRNNYRCPICRIEANKGNGDNDYNKTVHCYPFKRLLVSGHFWWRKYCPIPDIHYHIKCKKCNINWIVMDEEKPEIYELPLK